MVVKNLQLQHHLLVIICTLNQELTVLNHVRVYMALSLHTAFSGKNNNGTLCFQGVCG